MSEKTIRLNSVVKELNVGIQTLVEHLAKKGHKVDAKPTTKLSEEQYTILLNDFQSDKKVREDAKQLVKPKVVKKEEVILPAAKTKVAVTEDEEDDGILIKSGLAPNAPKKAETPAAVPPAPEKPAEVAAEPSEEGEEKPKLTVIGKINLEGINTKTRPEKKAKGKKTEKAAEEEKKTTRNYPD